MKFGRDQFNTRKLFISDHNSGFIAGFVQSSPYHQSGFRGCMADEIDDYLVTGQRATTPILGDKAEEAVFVFVPPARARGRMANLPPHTQFVRPSLEGNLPPP